MTPEESEKLTQVHTHVSYLRNESDKQDARITVLERWQAAVVGGFLAITSWFKFGGPSS